LAAIRWHRLGLACQIHLHLIAEYKLNVFNATVRAGIERAFLMGESRRKDAKAKKAGIGNGSSRSV
jgi:hypothetical protein